ncbi:MAG TPA: AAA family ATPase [Clostridiaceae bacterium]|nr:AAA family ATPase [Clostridiaceae bacterium]
MHVLHDYRISEVLHENNTIKVYRGYSVKNRMPVIIKALKKEAANPVEISVLIHEYEIMRNLDIDGIIKPVKFEQERTFFALVMEDVGAISLRKYIQAHTLDLLCFLDIAIQLSEILGQLHQRGVIHRDLKPENILICPDVKKCYIIDFSSAVLVPVENKNALPANNRTGTLEYMSPEQTGLLNIGVDRRSDLYSLGVVFYEILTGRLPLQAENPAVWAYAHLTKIPEPPVKINPDMPSVISDIIMKLLNKDPEERYQSSYGLMWDLKECKRQLTETGQISGIHIGRIDDSARFHLSGKFYGRKKEIKTLRAAFRRVCEGKTETILISGEPGIGKTMLVNESLGPAVLEKGYFIMGKADQLRKNIPYAPYSSAFGNLVKQLMTEGIKKLTWWKNKILHSIGRNCAVITEIIPELEWIVGRQPPVEPLPPQEAENRFLTIFRDFIKVFVRKDHPLVLFLDDLQWADHASVKLLKFLIQDANLRHLLILGAFRENELEKGHPLYEILEEHEELKGHSNKIQILLSPLRRVDVEKLVADTLDTQLSNSDSLAQWLYRKSAGNPFSLKQFLMLIHDEGLLYFNMQEGCWQWDLKAIQNLQQGEDVLELILKKIQKLPIETQELLMLASCYGNKFDLATLAAFWNKSPEKTAAALMPSIHEGLVIVLEKEETNSYYEFLHDRVQQAVYSLVTGEEKKKKHVMIGSYLLENIPAGNLEENILSVMDHFNRGLELIQDMEKRIRLARYNLMAGRKARASAAYASALEYFRCANTLMPEDAWERDYLLSFELHLEFAQALYLCGDTEAAEKLFDTILERSQTELERADVYGSKMILYAGIGKFDKAVHTGIQALKNLGLRIPVNPSALDYVRELFLYKWYMRDKNIEDLFLLPEMEDMRKRKILELLARLCYVTMATFPELYSFVIIKTGNFALRYGNSEVAPVGYMGYGIIAGLIFGDYEAGERYSKVGIELAEKYGRSSSKCIVYFVAGSLISHWTKHAAFGLDYLRKAVITGTEAGNLVIAGYSHCLLLENQYIMGTSLEKMNEEIREKYGILRKTKHYHLKINAAIYDAVVSVLAGRNNDTLASGVAELEKEELLNLAQEDKTSLATYYYCRMQMYYMAGDYRKALSMSQKVRPLLGAIIGFMVYAEYYFYDSLAITSLYNEMPRKERIFYAGILRKNLRKLRKWAQYCKENFEHKYLLICAQTAGLKNKREKAMSLYDRAIRSARIFGYIQNEALANELAAKFYLAQGMEKVAKTYMIDACNGYKKWGAVAKVNELQEKYPGILHEIYVENEINHTSGEFRDVMNTSLPVIEQMAGNLDSYFISKAIESISNETDLNKLLEGFLDVVVQSIGADSGYLILEEGGELFIEVLKDTNSSRAKAKTIPLEEYDDIAKSVVNYVARTLDTIVVNFGDQAGIFANDPYITESNPKSIACLPLLFRGIPFGVLYLENNFLPGVFAPQRLETVKLLTAQIAYAKKLQDYISEEFIENKEAECADLIEPLTEREIEVLNLIAKGMSNKEIADYLKITINTVKGHIKNIYLKLGVSRRLQAVTKAKALKILK